MIIHDKKKVTSLILSRMKDGIEKRMPVKSEVEVQADDDHPLTIAAQDVMQAFHDKSVLSLKASLCAFIDLHTQEEATEIKEE